MGSFGVNVWWQSDAVAFAETDQSELVSGESERAIAAGIGRIAEETLTLRAGPETITVTGLVFTNRGREVLSQPENLCAALNGREFELEIFDSDGKSLARYPHCLVRQPGTYLMVRIEEAVHETVTFSVARFEAGGQSNERPI